MAFVPLPPVVRVSLEWLAPAPSTKSKKVIVLVLKLACSPFPLGDPVSSN